MSASGFQASEGSRPVTRAVTDRRRSSAALEPTAAVCRPKPLKTNELVHHLTRVGEFVTAGTPSADVREWIRGLQDSSLAVAGAGSLGEGNLDQGWFERRSAPPSTFDATRGRPRSGSPGKVSSSGRWQWANDSPGARTPTHAEVLGSELERGERNSGQSVYAVQVKRGSFVTKN